MTSPFWTGFSITLTETFGATVLALPIAVAGPGPIPGLVVLIVLGAVNMVTLAAFIEAFIRHGDVRSGRLYLGGLVESYLGKPVALAIRLLLLVLLMMILSAYYIGVASTLGDELPVSPLLVTALMFLLGLVFLVRESLRAVVSASLLIGLTNIVLVLAIAALSLTRLHPSYLAFADTPFYGGHHFYLRVVGLLVGVVLAAYFGHLAVASCAAPVLQRDPTGRSLLLGCVAAEAAVMVLYAVWIVAVNGAVPRGALMADTSTAVVPLAQVVGPSVRVLGVAFVMLAMGMASIHASTGLRDTVAEWLPRVPATEAGKSSVHALLSMTPVGLVFLVTEWFLWHGGFSFSALLAYIGIAVVSVVGGFLPLFLVIASRRKGDRLPGVVIRFVGNQVLLFSLYLTFLGVIVVHGVFIWTNPEERVTAVLLGLLVAAMSVWIARTGALKPRLAVEVRADADRRRIAVSAMSHGRPTIAHWTLSRGDDEIASISTANGTFDSSSLDTITCSASSADVSEMVVRVHADTRSGGTEPISATVEILGLDTVQSFAVGDRSEACVIPLRAERVQTRISLDAQ